MSDRTGPQPSPIPPPDRHQIERLNSLLQTIYGSRTWKLHLFLDKLRGRR